MCVSEITWKIEFTRTRYNFIAKLASSWTINTLITGYTIIVYKVNQFMYVKTNKKCLYIVFELCEFYDEEFYEKINVYVCSTTRCRFIPNATRFIIDRFFLVNETKNIHRENVAWNHFRITEESAVNYWFMGYIRFRW